MPPRGSAVGVSSLIWAVGAVVTIIGSLGARLSGRLLGVRVVGIEVAIGSLEIFARGELVKVSLDISVGAWVVKRVGVSVTGTGREVTVVGASPFPIGPLFLSSLLLFAIK